MAVTINRRLGISKVTVVTTDIVYDTIFAQMLNIVNGTTAGAFTIQEADGTEIFTTGSIAANAHLQWYLERKIKGFKVSAAPAAFVSVSIYEKKFGGIF